MGRRTVIVQRYEGIVQEEYEVAAAITPGMLAELTSAGKVQPHSTAGGNLFPMFPIENALEGEGISDVYAVGEKARVWIPRRGDIVQCLLADGQNVAIGDFVESNGDGYVKKHVADKESFESAEAGSITVYPEQIVGQVVEAVDLSDSSGGESSAAYAQQRVKVRIR